jgi:hypothetical protein
MQASEAQREESRPNPSTLPAFAMFLMVGAAAIVQPHARSAEPVAPLRAPTTVRAATVRIALPPPAALTPPPRHRQAGTVRLLLRDLGPATPPPTALVISPVEAMPLSPAPAAIASDPATDPNEPASLVRSGGDLAAFSAKMSEITASLSAASGPQRRKAGPVDKPVDGIASGPAGSAADLLASSTSRPDPLAAPGERAQMILTEAMTPKKRTVPTVSLKVSATVNGGAVGRVALLIDDAENIQVRLSDLLAILEPELEPGLYAQLSDSQAAQSYMTLNDLRAAGIKVRFDENDRLVITTPA